VKIPTSIIRDVESETSGLTHGIVTLQLHIRDTHLSRYTINREKSVVTLTSAEGLSSNLSSNSLQSKELAYNRNKANSNNE